MGDIQNRQHVVKLNRPERSPAGEAFSRFAIVSLRLGGYLTAAGDRIAKPAGQTSARWQVLAGARNADKSVAAIAKILGVARQGIQRLADVLEAEGLVSYLDNPSHQKAKLVALTERGRAALDRIEQGQAGWANALGAAIGEAEISTALNSIEAILAVLEAQEAAPK
jgi:DNA-binding MarR family transcriptional regulator